MKNSKNLPALVGAIVVMALLAVVFLAFGDDGATSDSTGTDLPTTASTITAPPITEPTTTIVENAPETPATDTVAERFSDLPAMSRSELPVEALDTLDYIARDGPFPYSQDGGVFQNREGLLPDHPRGHYREYTVDTPGSSTRGARRIVAGADGEIYYTDDHYQSFREVVAAT